MMNHAEGRMSYDSGTHGFPQRCFWNAITSAPPFRFARLETKDAARFVCSPKPERPDCVSWLMQPSA